MIQLNNKRVLFLSPKYFGLEKGIIETLTQRGAVVKYYDARCVKSTFGKILIKKVKSSIYKKAEKYCKEIIAKETESFDYVIIFSADALSRRAVQMFRDAYLDAKMILYLWDDVNSSRNVLDFFDLFDDVYSFDSRDCEQYGIKFRPLYYNNTIKAIGERLNDTPRKYAYKMMFCGTIHSDRYSTTKKIIEDCNQAGYKTFYYPFLPSKIMYFYYFVLQKEFRRAKIDEFKYEPLRQEELAKITDSTEIVLDVTHPSQSGLTMRTIESIGLHKKLITTNKEIIKYDFYNLDNVCLIDRSNPVIPNEFWNCKYRSLSPDVYYRYSIDAFVDEILE